MSVPAVRSSSTTPVYDRAPNPLETQSTLSLFKQMWSQRQQGVGATQEQHNELAGRVTNILLLGTPSLCGYINQVVTPRVEQLDQYWSQGPNPNEGSINDAPGGVLDVPVNEIPEAFHEDPLFKELICPFTYRPIRYIATIKSGGVRTHDFHCEHKSLVEWINHCEAERKDPFIPQSRAPFRRSDVVRNLDLQEQIDARLAELLSTQ